MGRKGSARLCVAVKQQPVFVAKVQGEVFAHFYIFTIKRYSSMRNWLCGLPGRILYENPLDIKENVENALDRVLHLSRLFRSRWAWTFPLEGLLLFLKVITVHPALAASDNPGQGGYIAAVPLSDTSRNHMRPDTRLQIKRRNRTARLLSCVEFWIPRYSSTMLYRWTRYYNCCTDGSTNPGNYGCFL
jgi:hypothetical protein